MIKKRFLSLLVLLAAVVTGARAQTTYTVSVKEGTVDASNWQGKAGTGEYQALPLGGVAAGTAVSVKYNGTKKVKSVKAVKKGSAAAATSADKDKLICTEGHIHPYGGDPECTATRVARIVYIGPTGHATYTRGLALALTDEASTMAWQAAIDACSAKNTSTSVTGATWLLASQAQWDYMLGASGAGSYTALRDGFSSVGGSNLKKDYYWSSTEHEFGSDAYYYTFSSGRWYSGMKSDSRMRVRACLAFGAQVELTSTDGETWPLASMPDYDVELEVEYYDEVTLTDGSAITALNTHAGKKIWVNYTRQFTEGKTSTVCLPFAYTKKAGDGSFYAFTNIEKVGSEYVATMTEPAATTLTANTPYLYMPIATGNVNFGGAYTIPASLTAGSTTSNGWTFKGTFETIEWEEAPTGTYGFAAQDQDGIYQGEFVKVGDYVRIKPMRCYLENESFAGVRGMNRAAKQLPETIKVRLIGADGNETGIGTISTKTGEGTIDNGAWYSLDGRRIEGKPSTKGIYVNNGNKVVIK